MQAHDFPNRAKVLTRCFWFPSLSWLNSQNYRSSSDSENPTSSIRLWVKQKPTSLPSKLHPKFPQIYQNCVIKLTLATYHGSYAQWLDLSKMKARIPTPHALLKVFCSHCCYLPNLSKASAIAWFFTMSMSPRPKQKCGKIKNTDFRISLILFSF